MPHSSQQREALRRVLTDCNMSALFVGDEGLERLSERLDSFFNAYAASRSRIPQEQSLPQKLNFDGFLAQYEENPHRVHVLLQALAFLCSPEMLAMMWMVLWGIPIARLSYSYLREEQSRLEIELRLHDGTRVPFVSNTHWDAAILRFAAISQIDGQPMIESFYPLFIPPRRDQ